MFSDEMASVHYRILCRHFCLSSFASSDRNLHVQPIHHHQYTSLKRDKTSVLPFNQLLKGNRLLHGRSPLWLFVCVDSSTDPTQIYFSQKFIPPKIRRTKKFAQQNFNRNSRTNSPILIQIMRK